MNKRLAHYLALPYERTWESRHDDGDYLLVSLREIPQVCASGVDEEEAERRLLEALEDYVAWHLDDGLPIPEPSAPVVQAAVK